MFGRMDDLKEIQPHGEQFTMEVPDRLRDAYHSEYEPMSRAIFASSAIGCDVVLDIGASVGFYSLVAHHANPKAQIISIEASPENFQVLERNLNRVVPPGSAQAKLGTFGNFNSAKPSAAGIDPLTERDRVTTASLGIRPNSTILARVDVDGNETEVVEELLRLTALECEVRLLVAYKPNDLNIARNNSQSLFAAILQNGYRIFVIDEENLDFHEVNDVDDNHPYHAGESSKNIYCLPRTSCVHIATFLHSNGFGGAEKSHLEFCQDLISLGKMVRTFLPLSEVGIAPQLQRVGSPVVDCPMTREWWANDVSRPPASPLNHFFSPAANAWARGKDWSSIDATLTQTCVIATGALVALVAEKPHFWWIHEFGDIDHNLQFPLEISQMGRLFRDLSHQVMTNSDAVRTHFFPDDAHDVLVVGYNPKVPFPPLTAKPAVPNIQLVGSLHPGKGGDVFLRGLAELRSRGVEFTAGLRGTGASQRVQELSASIESLGLRGVVSIEQTLTTFDQLYSDATIVVVASRNEAFGRVPFEAVAFDCAVVYSRSGGLLEFMVDATTGLSFNPHDHMELAEKLHDLIVNPELRKKLVSGAKDTLFSEESRAANLGKLARIFQPGIPPFKRSTLQHVLSSELTRLDSWLTRPDSSTIDLDSLLSDRDAILNSKSWKITGPLRAFRRMMRDGNKGSGSQF